jgi:hypothetical protein
MTASSDTSTQSVDRNADPGTRRHSATARIEAEGCRTVPAQNPLTMPVLDGLDCKRLEEKRRRVMPRIADSQ